MSLIVKTLLLIGFLSLAAFSTWGQVGKTVPPSIFPLLKEIPAGTQYHLIAQVCQGNFFYYLISEPGEVKDSQALFVVDLHARAQLIARGCPVFPLKRYGLNDALIREIARQYVQDMIDHCQDGVQAIQDAIDYNPGRFVPTAPELIEAYQDAGVCIPAPRNP